MIENIFVTGSLVGVSKFDVPRTVLDLAARVALVLEAVLMAVVTVAYGAYAVLDQGAGRFYWGAVVVSALLTAGIGAVAWGFFTGRRFALGGAFAWQLLQGAAGVWLFGTMPALAVALLVASVIVAAAVMRRLAALPSRREEA